MDDGYTISGLNEGWTLAGARVMEWVSGLVMAMIVPELLHIKMATSGPLMIVVILATTFTLAGLRRQFPDEERGLRNAIMVGLGFEPPGIPSPAIFKPFWSGAPVRELPEKSYFKALNLKVLFEKDSGTDHGSIFFKNPVTAGSAISNVAPDSSSKEPGIKGAVK